MVRYFFAIGFALLFPFLAYAQTVSGKVTDESGQPLKGATIYCPETGVGQSTDIAGEFLFANGTLSEYSLIFQFVGMRTDTLELKGEDHIDITMSPDNMIEGVYVNARKSGSFISSAEAIKTEVISEVELTRAACCDLAGCFGTEASVHSATTNI
ncbi:MAG: hypothetical protein HKN89_10765, partial [Eudoraea sp.]|nr:hypothetical protein [Eudoraea sp.]